MSPFGQRIDLVHTSPVVTTALRRHLRSTPHSVRVETAVHSWDDFRAEWDFAGEIIVLDTLLDDHVPLPLKLRALRRLGSLPVVLGHGRETPFARRCGAEGAAAWIEPTATLADTAQAITRVGLRDIPEHARIEPAPAPAAALTDRELQVLTLYVSSRGHSPVDVGRVLALRASTVRSHIERGRARYRARGISTHTRTALRTALIDDGWFLEPTVWQAAGRA